MAEHRFVCLEDGTEVFDTTIKGIHTCPKCGADMAMNASVRLVRDGDYHHTSDSLAIHPDDIPVHRRLYPGIEVTPQGQPQFTSPKQQEAYALKSAGCYKKEQKKRTGRLGRVKIA